MQPLFQYTAKTLAGLESCLADELTQNGIGEIQKINRAVRFKATVAQMYKLNYTSRFSLKILREIDTFRIKNENDLYKNIKRISWNDYFSYKKSFVMDKTVHSDIFNNTHFAALRAKDAVADSFRDRYGIRPSVNTENPDVHLHVYVSHDTCTISLDTSGEPLFKRGYRKDTNQAPINEILAAGIIKLAGIDSADDYIFDPMCGSGTFLIEAAYTKLNIPANKLRKHFGFMALEGFDPKLWENVKAECDAATDLSREFKIFGADLNRNTVEIALENVRAAGLSNRISVKQADFFKENKPADKGILVFNPPYDKRMEEDNIIEFYKQIGDTLKQRYQGFRAHIISGNPDAFKFLGLKPDRKIQLFNGQIESELRTFSMYDGSRKNIQKNIENSNENQTKHN